MDFSEEGMKYEFRHYKKKLSPDNDYYDYRGKYICWKNDGIYCVDITPDKSDPTKCEINYTDTYSGISGTFSISRLCYQSFYLWDGESYIRVEKPFTFEEVEWRDEDYPV